MKQHTFRTSAIVSPPLNSYLLCLGAVLYGDEPYGSGLGIKHGNRVRITGHSYLASDGNAAEIVVVEEWAPPWTAVAGSAVVRAFSPGPGLETDVIEFDTLARSVQVWATSGFTSDFPAGQLVADFPVNTLEVSINWWRLSSGG